MGWVDVWGEVSVLGGMGVGWGGVRGEWGVCGVCVWDVCKVGVHDCHQVLKLTAD
jgi:hypothetical protein